MGSTYEKLDNLIVDAIRAKKNPLYEHACSQEASRIAELSGRVKFRVIDGRLTFLKKHKRIQWLTKAEANGNGGWKAFY